MRRRDLSGDPVLDVLDPYIHLDRPCSGACWVMSNMVGGLDGSAAVGGRVSALSTGRDPELFQRLRSLADVILVGASTVRHERYGPVRLPPDLYQRRAKAGLQQPRLAIVSRSLDLPIDLPLFHGDQAPIVFTTSQSDRGRLAQTNAELVVAGDDEVDLARVIAELGARSLRTVLCEGGPTLLGDLIAAGLLDEYLLTLTPVIGGDALPLVVNREGVKLSHFELRHVYDDDGSLFLRYTRRGNP
jgi:riboflavin biosynthesis pyrimidine reductase